MNLTIIDYLIIAIIVALVMNTLMDYINGPKNDEEFDNTNLIKSENKMIENDKPSFSYDGFIKLNDNTDFYNADKKNENDFVNDVIFNGKFNTPTQETNIDLEGYRDDFWNFNEKINRDTTNRPNEIDTINMLKTTNNNEKIAPNGMTIANFYDGLTKNETNLVQTYPICGKSLSNCFSDEQIKKIENYGSVLKNDQQGNYYTTLNWNNKIDNDDVFFDNVEGYDSRSDHSMAF
jgi:hypothetical protein